tara:strand:+ start:2067 stop:7541 length:5475 start_codon:yes stop_codon:yes gene_type:complete
MAYNFNTSPYYDDFNPDDRFLKILFNPGRAVQARELTQIQSILQNQMASAANHIWKNGAPVVGGGVSVSKRSWLQVASADSTWLNRIVYGETSLAVAVIEQLHDDETQPIYYYRALSGEFADNENLFTYDTVCDGGFDVNGDCIDNSWYDPTMLYKAGVIVSIGQALEAKVADGVYWLDSFFTPVLSQTIFLDPLSPTPTCKVGFDIEEIIVESTTDPRLLDPASGFYNQNAPGGDRYQKSMNLCKDVDSAEQNKWMWMMDVDNGKMTTKFESTDYSLLATEMAKRTFDESGNYTINPFPIEMKEGSDADHFGVKVEPSKAYINGFEHELLSPITIEAERARTTRHVANDHLKPEFGPYFEVESVDDLHGVFNVVQKEYVIFVTDPGHTSSNTNPNTIGVHKRITHVTMGLLAGSYTMGFRIYLENDVGLDAVAPALYIVSEVDNAVYAKLYRPTGSSVAMGVHYPWLYKVSDVTESLTLGQVTYSTQKNSTAIITGSVASVPAVFVDMHWERILYIWNNDANGGLGGLIPKNGTVSGNVDTWVEDLTGNTTALITIINQGTGSPSTNLTGDNITIMADMYMSNASWRNITFMESASSNVVLAGTGTGASLTLPHAVTEITSVIAPDAADVTADFSFINGDTDTTFNAARLEWIGDPLETQVGSHTVTYNHYNHGNVTTAAYFAVNSYTDAGIIYDAVPGYRDSIGGEHPLTDELDFRTSELDYAVGTYLPLPESSISVSFDYYLGRRDRLTINDDGKIQIKQGFPSDAPMLPTEERNEMTLYNLFIPPYTYWHKNINVSHVEQKRYTMQDIRGMEGRLENLEYYTSLNLLEKSTADMQVLDENGLQRYKNGILTDPFVDHGIGDVSDSNYYCTVYPEARICTVPYEMYGLDCEPGVTAGVIENNLTYTLNYTVQEAWIKQDHGTQVLNLNPFARKSWVGFATLTPSTDTWFEEKYVPDVIIQNKNNNAVLEQVEQYGTQTRWNAWETTWSGFKDKGGRDNVQTGREVTFTSNASSGFNIPGGIARAFESGKGGTVNMGWRARRRTVWREIVNTESWDQQQQMTSSQVRSGERSHMEIKDIRTEVGDRSIDVSSIPWMRSIPVKIDVDKLRPNTHMHFQFDEIDVDAYITPDGGVQGDPVMTDEKGKIRNAVFQIPSEGAGGVRIRSGMKVLAMKDNFVDFDAMTTQAVATFTAKGTLDTRQKDIMSTFESYRVAETLAEDRTVLGETRTVSRSQETGRSKTSRSITEWYDPVAESFLIGESDGGAFIHSIDLYFYSKDDESTPVRLEIRPMVNGYPTATPLPTAQVMLYPEDVSVSTNGAISTRFQFADPIYLMDGTEYCFVVISDSLLYNLWISELGEVDLLTGDYVSEQPYLGSMFTSQNNTTWTPEQLMDVKFRMNKCQFDPSGSVQINLKEFVGIKEVASFTPNFQPMVLSGSTLDMEVIINGDTNNSILGIQDNEEVVLEEVEALDGAQTIASGYQYTPISYNVEMKTGNPNISPVLNKERLSTIAINNIIWDTSPIEKNQKGVYLSKDVKLANFASDLQMFLSVQEGNETYVKVFYDTGSVTPRTITVMAYANLVTYGDYNVNDFEEYYAYIYPAGANSPDVVIRNNSQSIGSWTGTVAEPGQGPSAQVSTAYVDGDDDESNLWSMSLVDISDMKNIVTGCFICTEDLAGVGHDITSSGAGVTDLTEYEVGDVWYGTWDQDTDRKFWKKIILPDGSYAKEEVPILEIDSQVAATHPDFPIGLAVIEGETIMWREMKDGGVQITNTAMSLDAEFIEHTFTPLKKVVKEFDHFRVKIELHTTHRCTLPAIREMRVLAVT